VSRAKQRANRIRDEIPIIKVLEDLGYRVRSDAGDREQQFPCDLHGDGRDQKPSARVYPSSGSWYCFACGKSRDAIDTLQEKSGLEFSKACNHLEKSYGLSPLPWVADDYQSTSISSEISSVFTKSRSFEDESSRTKTFLDAQTSEKLLPIKAVLGAWEAFDKITWLVAKEQCDKEKAIGVLASLREKLTKHLKGMISEGRL